MFDHGAALIRIFGCELVLVLRMLKVEKISNIVVHS